MVLRWCVRRRASLVNTGSARVARPGDTVRPLGGARQMSVPGAHLSGRLERLMPGTASPAPRVRLKLVASARVSQHTMPGDRPL